MQNNADKFYGIYIWGNCTLLFISPFLSWYLLVQNKQTNKQKNNGNPRAMNAICLITSSDVFVSLLLTLNRSFIVLVFLLLTLNK